MTTCIFILQLSILEHGPHQLWAILKDSQLEEGNQNNRCTNNLVRIILFCNTLCMYSGLL